MSAHRTTTLSDREVTDAPSQDPDTEGARLFVETVGADRNAGEAASYVFLHGLGGTHRYWSAADALPEGFPITFIHGTLDTTAPISQIQRLVQHRREWRLIELVGVDHHPWLREPVTCAGAITATPATTV